MLYSADSVKIPRNDDELLQWFVQRNLNDKQFGVIVGPTGTGKTEIVRTMCNKIPEGVLYHEVVESKSFTENLARELNMKIAPSNFLDIVLGYFSTIYTMYYSLPVDRVKALDVIIEELKSAALK